MPFQSEARRLLLMPMQEENCRKSLKRFEKTTTQKTPLKFNTVYLNAIEISLEASII